jgi:hypothetical protein
MVGTAGEDDVRCALDCCQGAAGLRLGMLLRAYCWPVPEPPWYTTGAVTVEGKPWTLFL